MSVWFFGFFFCALHKIYNVYEEVENYSVAAHC